jgi:hypothetical protein
MQMRAHDKIDVVHAEPARREALLVAIGIHHVPEAARRARFMVAHAGVDHDRMMRRPHDVALNAKYQLVIGIDKSGLQPPAVLVEKLLRQRGKKLHRIEERALLFDDAVDRRAANFDRAGQVETPSPDKWRVQVTGISVWPVKTATSGQKHGSTSASRGAIARALHC